MTECIRCDKSIEDLYYVCTECAEDLFSHNIFWIASSPVIGGPVIDRYKEDSEATLRIGDLPDDELEFRSGIDTLKEIKSLQVEEMEPDDYMRVQKRMATILAELGVTKEFEPEGFIFSNKDVEVFSEIFYLLEEMEHKFTKRVGNYSLYLRMGNLFFYTGREADISAFEMEFREKVKNDLLKEAEGYYQLALEASDEDSEENFTANYNKGLLHLETKDMSEAKERFESALDIKNDDFDSQLGLVRALIGLDNIEECKKKLDKLMDDHQDEPEVWFLRGEVAKEEGRWGGAIQFYNQCLKIDDSFDKAFVNKCNILLEREMYSQANDLFDDYIQKDQKNAEAWFGKAKALHGMDKWGGALQCINEAVSLDPQIKEAWLKKGDILADKEQFDMASKAYEKALKIDPDYEEAQKKLDFTSKKVQD